ncbi:unnamed protein product [Urochloa humidicola]
MATTPQSLLSASASGGLLVMSGGGLMGPRLILAPAGTHRLSPGAHSVVAVSAAAVPGAASTGRRGAMLVVAGATGAEAEADSTAGINEYLYHERKNSVIQSWEFVERNYRADAYFGDVKQFGESASKGIVVLRKLLDMGKGYSSADMTALTFAGQCFFRVALQAKQGYIQDATVVEAVQSMQLVCSKLHIQSPAPSDPSVVPYDPEVGVYFKELSDAVADFIDGVTRAVQEAAEA